MQRTLVLNVVGLSPGLLGPHTPNLSALAAAGRAVPLRSITPAVTGSVQSTFVTGTMPSEHGIVANGWYFRDLSEVWLWRQSNHLVAGEKIWDAAKKRDAAFRCAKMFWWYNMYSSADYSVTPRPMYPADGRKLPDIYADPPELRDVLNRKLGQFPLFNFWGPNANIASSRWIAEAARYVHDAHEPTLNLVYLPHLDYALQKLGPNHPDIPQHVRDIDAISGELIAHVKKSGVRVIVLSEYGITPVTDGVHINRALRRAGLIRVREEQGLELLDPGACEAFAVSDHQIAHVYVRNRERIGEVRQLLEGLDGVDLVLDDEGKRKYGLAHPRSGELVALSKPDRWFTYYYWLDDDRAPDFARCVEIHRKPGYDPVELFFDPKYRFPKLHAAYRVAKKLAGFRMLMDLIPLDASLVRGSHGRVPEDPRQGAVFITSEPEIVRQDVVEAVDVKGLVLDHVFDERPR